MSPSQWPKFGSVAYADGADPGEHYSVAYPQWEDKPIAFANFPRAASFVNALVNGDVTSRKTSTEDGVEVVTYSVRLSDEVEDGMYDLSGSGATRKEATGFVVPSNDEWIKAAYYDPKGSGTFSYWRYPTGPAYGTERVVARARTGTS